MDINEAIKHCREKSCNTECGREHEQLAQWLEELLELRKTSRHGKWVYIFEPDENDNVQCNCSVCGARDLHAKDMVVPYCWKCGANMDGEKK